MFSWPLFSYSSHISRDLGLGGITETQPSLRSRPPLIHMQIRATDRGGGYFNQCIIGMLEFWEGPLFDGYFEGFCFLDYLIDFLHFI